MWKYRKIDTTRNDVSNVQLIPNPYKMDYAVYNLTSNSIELCTIDIHSSKYGELKLDWDTIVNILDDGIRFKREHSCDEADGIYVLLAYDFESRTVFKIMASSSADNVFNMLLSNFLKSFEPKKADEENAETIVDSDAISSINSTEDSNKLTDSVSTNLIKEDTGKLTDSVSTKLIKEEEHNDDKEKEYENHDIRNLNVGLVGKNKMIM